MFSCLATSEHFCYVHSLSKVRNVQWMFSANVQSFCQGFTVSNLVFCLIWGSPIDNICACFITFVDLWNFESGHITRETCVWKRWRESLFSSLIMSCNETVLNHNEMIFCMNHSKCFWALFLGPLNICICFKSSSIREIHLGVLVILRTLDSA